MTNADTDRRARQIYARCYPSDPDRWETLSEAQRQPWRALAREQERAS